jgi:hypothetical protein
MRLQQYITEYKSDLKEIMPREDDPRLDEVLKMLEKDCKKFIDETEGFLFRGTNRRIGDLIKKNTARSDRNPVDTSARIHKMADISFKEKFGWKARSEGVFTATRDSMTKGYGANLYLVFPIGNFGFVWSEEHYDFYIAQSEAQSNKRDRVTHRNYSLDQSDVDLLIDDYTNKNLKQAFADRQAREVILHCPNGYYYVNSMMIGELSHYLGIERY